MARYYLELPIFDAAGNRSYKYVVYDELDRSMHWTTSAHRSNRIWKDDGSEVTWTKNRLAGTAAKIDKNEFLMVQLKAVPNRRATLKL
jgi:hypothetical protein